MYYLHYYIQYKYYMMNVVLRGARVLVDFVFPDTAGSRHGKPCTVIDNGKVLKSTMHRAHRRYTG